MIELHALSYFNNILMLHILSFYMCVRLWKMMYYDNNHTSMRIIQGNIKFAYITYLSSYFSQIGYTNKHITQETFVCALMFCVCSEISLKCAQYICLLSDILVVKLTFEMFTVCGQYHPFSTHNGCSFESIGVLGTRTPKVSYSCRML